MSGTTTKRIRSEDQEEEEGDDERKNLLDEIREEFSSLLSEREGVIKERSESLIARLSEETTKDEKWEEGCLLLDFFQKVHADPAAFVTGGKSHAVLGQQTARLLPHFKVPQLEAYLVRSLPFPEFFRMGPIGVARELKVAAMEYQLTDNPAEITSFVFWASAMQGSAELSEIMSATVKSDLVEGRLEAADAEQRQSQRKGAGSKRQRQGKAQSEFEEEEFSVQLEENEVRIAHLKVIMEKLSLADFAPLDEEYLAELSLGDCETLGAESVRAVVSETIQKLCQVKNVEVSVDDLHGFEKATADRMYVASNYKLLGMQYSAPLMQTPVGEKSLLQMCVDPNYLQQEPELCANFEDQAAYFGELSSWAAKLRTGRPLCPGSLYYVRKHIFLGSIASFCGDIKERESPFGTEADQDKLVFTLCHDPLELLDQVMTHTVEGRTFRGGEIFADSFHSTANAAEAAKSLARPDATRLHFTTKKQRVKHLKKRLGKAAVKYNAKCATFHAEHKSQSVLLADAEFQNETKYAPKSDGIWQMSSGGVKLDDGDMKFAVRFSYLKVDGDSKTAYRMSPIIYPYETPLLFLHYAILAWANGA